MQSIKQTTINSAKWSAIETFSLQGVRFVLGIIMARLLTPADYGIISMISIFIAVSEIFINSGFSMALVRQKTCSKKDLSTVFYFNIIIAIACYFILFFASPYIAEFFRTPIITSVLRIFSITVIINSLMSVYVAKMTIDLDFRAIAMRSLLSGLLSGIIGIALAYNNFGVWALVYQSIAASAINLIFILIYCRWLPLLVFSKESFHRLFNYGKNMFLSSLLQRIYTSSTSIVIGKFFSTNALGLYDRGTSLASFPVNSVNGILAKITLPILAKVQDDNERLISAYRKYISVSSFIIFFGCCLLASQAKPVILLLFKAKWASAIILLQIYSFAIMFEHITTINLTLLQVVGRSDLYLRLEFIKKGISIAMLFGAVPFGVIGICASRVIYTQIAIIFNTYYNGKLFGLNYFEQFKDYCPYFLFALISCIPSYIITFFNLPHIVSIISGMAIATSIYFICSRRTEGMSEFKSLILHRKN